jgi:hypothetical protein
MPNYDHNLAFAKSFKVPDPAVVICRDSSYRTKSWKSPHIVGRGKTRDLALADYFTQVREKNL